MQDERAFVVPPAFTVGSGIVPGRLGSCNGQTRRTCGRIRRSCTFSSAAVHDDGHVERIRAGAPPAHTGRWLSAGVQPPYFSPRAFSYECLLIIQPCRGSSSLARGVTNGTLPCLYRWRAAGEGSLSANGNRWIICCPMTCVGRWCCKAFSTRVFFSSTMVR